MSLKSFMVRRWSSNDDDHRKSSPNTERANKRDHHPRKHVNLGFSSRTIFGEKIPKDFELSKPKKRSNGKLASNIWTCLNDLREQARVDGLVLTAHDHEDHDVKVSKKFFGGWALSRDQMKHLQTKPYEYNAFAGSVLELLMFQNFWIFLASFIPESVAPCTITAIGFLINLVTCSTLISFSPDAKSGEVPAWALYLCAAGIFFYQIADALDGKQCFKVQETQIEEFYDHGCDSVSTVLLMYSIGVATQAGYWPSLHLAVIFTSLVAFYCTHWLNYCTNQMVFGRIDVTEAQWSMIIVHTLSAWLGQSIWQHCLFTVFGWRITANIVLSCVTLLVLATAIGKNFRMIVLGLPTPLEELGIEIPRRDCSRLRPLIPAFFLATLTIHCYRIGYYHLNPALFVMTFGLTFAKLTIKLVITHCTNVDLELWDPSLLAPMMLSMNGQKFLLPLISCDKALWCAFICNSIELIRYFTCISWDLSVALDVWIFSRKYPTQTGYEKRRSKGFYVNGLNNREILEKWQQQQKQQ